MKTGKILIALAAVSVLFTAAYLLSTLAPIDTRVLKGLNGL